MEAIIDRKALPIHIADPSLDLVSTLTQTKRLLRGYLGPSRWDNNSLLCQRISMFTPGWIIPSVIWACRGASGPLSLQAVKTSTVNKLIILIIFFNATHIFLLQCFYYISQGWPRKVYALTNSLTLNHCLLIILPCLENFQYIDAFINMNASNNQEYVKCQNSKDKVWMTLGTLWIHTSWVCGSDDETAEGFGFTGGIGGFGFIILKSGCWHFTRNNGRTSEVY